jgi:hypothetical protein
MKNMKKVLNRLPIIIMVFLFPFSCNEDFINTKPIGQASSSVTWTDGALTQAFVYGVYSQLGYGGYEEQMLAVYTDEAMFTHAGRNINTFTEGNESPANRGWVSPTYAWESMYAAIRQANIAIANIPLATFDDQALKDRLLGESYFLRAYFYHQLLRFYGSFAIVDKVYGLSDDYTIARNTWDECVAFIVSDLDKSAQLLDGKEATPGRTSKLAALALKARVLVYNASSLHESTANSSLFPGFAHPEFYTSTQAKATKWSTAKTAAKEAFDAGVGYKLNLSAPVTPEEGKANYVAIAMGGGSATSDKTAAVELIFQRTETLLFTQENNWPLGGLHFGTNNGPNGYHCWAGNTPIQQLVDDYEMMDGSKFDWNNSTHANAPYDNRDPRFYATVLYDGANWKPRPDDVAGIDPVNQIQTGYYDNGSGGTISGVDTRESSVENWNGSRTHYYVRKFMDPDPAVVDNLTGAQVIPWPFIRYTEVVLNYIETLLETGDETTAKDLLNKIRFRAGMPATSATGAALVDVYRNERRIELAYEEHRYHDVRRWMIPATTVGRGIKDIHVTATLKAGKTVHIPYRYDPTVYDYTYTVEDNTSNETRTWKDKMYFRVLARDEINRNCKLIQNPDYEVPENRCN